MFKFRSIISLFTLFVYISSSWVFANEKSNPDNATNLANNLLEREFTSNWGNVYFYSPQKLSNGTYSFKGYWVQDRGRLGVVTKGNFDPSKRVIKLSTEEPFLLEKGMVNLKINYDDKLDKYYLTGKGKNLGSGETFEWEMVPTKKWHSDAKELQLAEMLKKLYKRTCPAHISGCSTENLLDACHSSCGEFCQNTGDAKAGSDDCMSCKPGQFLNVVYRDGTGICTRLNF